eukprot:GHVT01024538.1.p1 GENE.GHVT01024538.1~~GHVT01024538.1.p1  ORF type:complete len:142 (-),score=8.61 GHVT01024538.1:584-1009(-)
MEDDALSREALNSPLLQGNMKDYHPNRIMLRTPPLLHHHMGPKTQPNKPETDVKSFFSNVGHTPNGSRVFYEQQQSRHGMARSEGFCETKPGATARMLHVPTFGAVLPAAGAKAIAAVAASVLPGPVLFGTSWRKVFHPKN